MRTMTIFEPLDPPRATAQSRRHTKNGTFRTEASKRAMATWKAAVRPHKPPEPITGPVLVFVNFMFLDEKLKVDSAFKTTRPDADNMAKDLFDAMTQEGFWLDDAQIHPILIRSWNRHASGIVIHIAHDFQQGDDPLAPILSAVQQKG